MFKDDNPFPPFDIHSEQVQKMYQMSYDFFFIFLGCLVIKSERFLQMAHN